MRLKIKERMLIASLRDSNVYKVMIDYSGGGDDGCIDYLEAFDSKDKSIGTKQVKKTLNELEPVKMAKENRRYIEQVILPSYGISDGWKNKYHDEWVLKGGFKD